MRVTSRIKRCRGRVTASDIVASPTATGTKLLRVDISFNAGSRTFMALTVMCLRGMSLMAKFALTLFIARFMDLETVGLYGLIAGIAVVFPVIASLGLIRILSRNAVSQQLDEITRTLRQYWRIQAAVYAMVAVVGFMAGSYFDQVALVMIVIAIVFLEHVNGDLFVLLNHVLQPRLANGLMFVRTAGWITLFIAFSVLFPTLRDLRSLLEFWIAGGVLAILGFGLATRHWPWLRPRAVPEHRDWLARDFRASRILYVNDIANTVAQYTDRYLVGLFMGLEFTGVYVVFWSIGNALSNLVDTGVIQISGPKLIGAHARQDGTFWTVYRQLLVETVTISVAIAVAAALLVHLAIPYLQRPLLAEWLPVLWLILLGFVLRMVYEVQGSVFYSRHKDHLILFSGLLVIGLSIGANIVLIPLFALYGAAIAIVVSYFAGAIVRSFVIARYCR